MPEWFSSILLGLVGGMVGWTLVQLFLVPRLRWSPVVIKRPRSGQPSGYAYMIKYKNASWVRPIIELELQARISMVEPTDDGRGKVIKSLRVGSSASDVKILRPRANQLLSVVVSDIDEKTLTWLRERGHDSVLQESRTLEELLALPQAFLSVQVTANDGWTGTQQYRESPRYRLRDDPYPIVERPFALEKRRIDRAIEGLNKRHQEAPNKTAGSRLTRTLNPELQPVPKPPAPGAKQEPSTGASRAKQN